MRGRKWSKRNSDESGGHRMFSAFQIQSPVNCASVSPTVVALPVCSYQIRGCKGRRQGIVNILKLGHGECFALEPND